MRMCRRIGGPVPQWVVTGRARRARHAAGVTSLTMHSNISCYGTVRAEVSTSLWCFPSSRRAHLDSNFNDQPTEDSVRYVGLSIGRSLVASGCVQLIAGRLCGGNRPRPAVSGASVMFYDMHRKVFCNGRASP